MWWSVFWPWALVWAITLAAAAGVLSTLVVLVLRWRRGGRTPQPTPGISFYLNENALLQLYLRDTYKPALRKEIEEQIVSTNAANLSAELQGVGGVGGSRTVNRQIFMKYVEGAEPTRVIRTIMGVLEKADDILYIDLMDGVVEPDRSLQARLNSSRDTELAFSELGKLGSYLSIWGNFREVAKTADTISFAASPESDGDRPAQVVFTCPIADMRPEDVPDGPFMARCLGRVRAWDATEAKLLINPIAVFD